MTEINILQVILNGLFTGIGVGFANYLHEKHISKKLDFITKKLKRFRR